MFNRRSLSNNYRSWLLRTGPGVEVVEDVAGRMAVLHINAEESRDLEWVQWEGRVRSAVQQMEKVHEEADADEIADVLNEKLGDAPHGFVVLVRRDLQAHSESLTDVSHERELCCRYKFPFHCLPLICMNCCYRWTFVIGRK